MLLSDVFSSYLGGAMQLLPTYWTQISKSSHAHVCHTLHANRYWKQCHMPGMGNPAYNINAYPSTQRLRHYPGTIPLFNSSCICFKS